MDNISPWTGFELTTLVVIDTDCTGSCKSNYHTITTNIRGGSRRGGSLKKIAPSGGRPENFWGMSCEKSRFYAKKSPHSYLKKSPLHSECISYVSFISWILQLVYKICAQNGSIKIITLMKTPVFIYMNDFA
jgi:hypothetical protein